MSFKICKFKLQYLLIFIFIYCNNKFNSIASQTIQDTNISKVPGYFSLLKAKQERKDQEAENNKTNTEEKKNNLNEKDFEENNDSGYSKKYLAKIFQNLIFNKKKISINSANINIQDLINLIGKVLNIDFVIDTDVGGTINKLNFKNVTPGFLLNYILVHNNPPLALIKDMNFWRIMRRENAEEYIKFYEKEEISCEIFDINNASMNDKFRDLLEKTWNNIIADSKAVSSIFIDNERKKVFVRSFPQKIAEFKKILKEVDRHVTQVRIDAIIVFAEKDYNFSFGINWSGIYNRQNTISAKRKAFDFVGLGGTLFDYPKPAPQNALPNNANLLVNPADFAINLFTRAFTTPREVKPPQISDTYISIPFVFGGPDLNLRRLNLLLNAAENEEKVKIVSKPSVMTSDNEVAKILIGETIPIQATAIDILAVAVQNISSINYKDIGISFEVHPVISPDKKNIKLEIFIEESKVIAGTTVTNEKGIMQNPPVIDIIKVHNKVNLRNGQTVVIGGLSRCDERKGKNKVPFLHKLPVIGKWLFTATAHNKEEFEQFIFITPTIVD